MLGVVEVKLESIMSDSKMKNRMCSRTDRLTDIGGAQWPGEIEWECGFFSKTTLEQHLANKDGDANKIKQNTEHQTERELREAQTLGSGKDEIDKQKQADLKDRSDEIISGSAPTPEWPSGVLAIHIEQIRGLMVQKTRESGVKDSEEEDEEGPDLPSAYCTIILNHQRVYKTRTKLKSNKPFVSLPCLLVLCMTLTHRKQFAAGTERFIKDWRTASLIIAVRDSRTHEADPLIGVVVLPLQTLFKDRSQISQAFPLTGGIGYGRMQVRLFIFITARTSL